MPRGKGRQTGEEQQAFPQATDLSKSPPIVPGGENRAALEQAIDAAPGAEAAQAPPPANPGMTPDDAPNLLDPSTRPWEPIQSGLAQGPGVGPLIDQDRDMADMLAALYRRHPTPALRQMVENAGRRGR